MTKTVRVGEWWFCTEAEMQAAVSDGGRALATAVEAAYPFARGIKVLISPWTDAALLLDAPEGTAGTVGWTADVPSAFVVLPKMERLN